MCVCVLLFEEANQIGKRVWKKNQSKRESIDKKETRIISLDTSCVRLLNIRNHSIRSCIRDCFVIILVLNIEIFFLFFWISKFNQQLIQICSKIFEKFLVEFDHQKIVHQSSFWLCVCVENDYLIQM